MGDHREERQLDSAQGTTSSSVTVLRAIEQKIESLFEGVFSRAFRTHVQPVELARKLAKEMDEHKLVSVSKTYVPNEYTVYLSPADREQLATYESSLTDELREYLADHARREGYALHTRPKVELKTDEDLAVGEFGIATRMVPVERPREPAGPPVEPAPTMIYRPELEEAKAEPPVPEALRESVVLVAGAKRYELRGERLLIGRSKECDVQVTDANASRRHAEVVQEGSEFWLVDLDSTNGTEVNGRRTARAKLDNGDRIMVGSAELVFTRELR